MDKEYTRKDNDDIVVVKGDTEINSPEIEKALSKEVEVDIKYEFDSLKDIEKAVKKNNKSVSTSQSKTKQKKKNIVTKKSNNEKKEK